MAEQGTIATAVDSVAKIADVMTDDDPDSALVQTLCRIADSLDRVVTLLEDVAAAIDLPVSTDRE